MSETPSPPLDARRHGQDRGGAGIVRGWFLLLVEGSLR